VRAVLVIFGVLVVVELGSQLPLTHAAIGAAQHPGGEVTLGSLLVGLVLCLPIVGFFRLFRLFHLWQRDFHARMKAQGVARRGR
jgi:hypothetical protein